MTYETLVPISLRKIWEIENPEDYKVHFARHNKIVEPLEVWARSKDEWRGWQEYRPKRDEFNRPRIFALMQFYHETDVWLFGGVFRVVERQPDAYRVELTDELADFQGRLKLWTPYRGRTARTKLEEQYDNFKVLEVLREPYSGTPFPGLSSIDVSFDELETIVKNERTEWKAALQHVGGIYVIADTQTDRLYVGAAYGEGGVWSRWSNYVDTGDGGNVELREVIGDSGLDYCRQHFRLALVETLLETTPDQAIAARETYWKQVLLSRGKRGFNKN